MVHGDHQLGEARKRRSSARTGVDDWDTISRQRNLAIKIRGHFPDEQAATKLIYLAIERAETK